MATTRPNATVGPSPGQTAIQAAKLSVLTLAIMNVTAVVSLRGLPSEATYGLTSVFYYIFAAIFFLIPVSIVAAELATGWPQKGGVFRWVGEAFGPRWGFLAIFLVWVESTIWFPTVLTFGAVAIAFAGPGQKWDEALAANKLYTIAIVLVVYWAATWVTLHGLRSASRIAKWGGMIGTIIPAAILIVLGFTYYFSGHHIQVPVAWRDLVPDFTNFNNLVLAAGIFLFYAGMEMNAIHVKDIANPSRNYPLAILISSVITVAIFVLGTLAIAFIIPASQINLVQSLLITYDSFFKVFGIDWLSPVMALALAFGVLGGVTVWVAGPSSALAVVGRAGYLPPFFQKMNAHGAPTHILVTQGLIVTFLSIMFVVLPSVQAAYQILSQLTVTLYLIMYLLMFAAAIHLRYSEPATPRPYRVPFGSAGMWIFAGVGLVGSLIAFILSFVPPSQISVGSPRAYVWILIAGNVIVVAIPFIIFALRKPHWQTVEGSADFEPFNWQKEGRMPGTQQVAPVENAGPPLEPSAPAMAGARRTFRNRETSMTITADAIKNALEAGRSAGLAASGGKNADYIPFLASVPSTLFGTAVVTADGQIFKTGDADFAFAIESISKVFTLALVMETIGPEAVHKKVGADPTGLPFNSVIALELHNGKPLSPLVNAGAIATASLVPGDDADACWAAILRCQSRFAGRKIVLSDEVNHSEQTTNFHNRAIAWLLYSAGACYSDPMRAVDVYTRQCSTLVTATDLAAMGATLAADGVNPITRERVIAAANTAPILAEMAMEGLYTASGDWAFTVGLPGKSGVGGGVLAVVPGELAIAAFSPPLDPAGNSVRGLAAVAAVAKSLGCNLFQSRKP